MRCPPEPYESPVERRLHIRLLSLTNRFRLIGFNKDQKALTLLKGGNGQTARSIDPKALDFGHENHPLFLITESLESVVIKTISRDTRQDGLNVTFPGSYVHVEHNGLIRNCQQKNIFYFICIGPVLRPIRYGMYEGTCQQVGFRQCCNPDSWSSNLWPGWPGCRRCKQFFQSRVP